MIITGLLTVILNVLFALLPVSLSPLPPAVQEVFNKVIEYFTEGLKILRCFIGADAMQLLGTLLSFILSVHIFLQVWTFTVWVLKKVPFISFKE